MKALILASFAFLGSLVYSSTISWGTDSVVYGPSGSTDWSGTAFLYMVESNSGHVPSWSQEHGWDTTGATFIASQTVSKGDCFTASTVDQNTQFKPKGSGYYYMVVYTTATVSSLEDLTSGAYAISDNQELFDGGTLPGSSEYVGELYFNEDKTLTWFQISDVPEPTALALLALGVAGLALKRRAA